MRYSKAYAVQRVEGEKGGQPEKEQVFLQKPRWVVHNCYDIPLCSIMQGRPDVKPKERMRCHMQLVRGINSPRVARKDKDYFSIFYLLFFLFSFSVCQISLRKYMKMYVHRTSRSGPVTVVHRVRVPFHQHVRHVTHATVDDFMYVFSLCFLTMHCTSCGSVFRYCENTRATVCCNVRRYG